MLRFVVRRLLLLVPILIGVSILVFAWIRALPGSPAESLLGERATPQAIAQTAPRPSTASPRSTGSRRFPARIMGFFYATGFPNPVKSTQRPRGHRLAR